LHASRDIDLRSHLYDLPRSGGTPKQLTRDDHTLSLGTVAVTTDGSVFFTAQDVGPTGRDFVGRSTGVFVLDGDEATRLTDPDHDFGEAGSTLTATGRDTVLAVDRRRGSGVLMRISRTEQTDLTDETQVVEGQAAAGTTIAVSSSNPHSHGEVGFVEGGSIRSLTAFHGIDALETIEHTIRARDGYEVHGWVTLPEGEGPHPVLLMIHGGPFSSYQDHFFDEAQVYAGAGYAVVYCNPRGSAGYGEDHGRATRQKMGTLDYTDVIDFLEGAIAAEPSLDGERLGILGGSYGGYLTAWTIAHDTRFAAAIVERGFLDPEVFPGTSDIGDFFGQEYLGTELEAIRAQSPQAVAHLVTTPTFVIHSADDLRCPLGQAERYYATLKARGVESELLIFPGENHELTRSGRPRHRVERFDAILEWWSRYLPVERR